MKQAEDVPLQKLSVPSRKLKVYYAYRGNGFNNRYPVIRFGGSYLNTLGFLIGTEFMMELDTNRITLTRIASPCLK